MLTDILDIWTPDNGDGYALITDLAAFADTVETAILNPPYIRLSSTNDASPSSTDHAFQIGPTSGVNLIIDNNEIMARNGGAENGLGLNLDGGNVGIGNAQSIVTVTGRINSNHYPWAYAAGALSMGSIAPGDTGSVTVTLPGGRFTQTPIITTGINSTAPHLRATSITAVSTTSVTFVQRNDTGTTGSAAVTWQAVQMTASTAGG